MSGTIIMRSVTDTNGRAVFGFFGVDGERTRLEGYDFERLATDEEAKAAKVSK